MSMELGNRLATLRKEKGISQEELASQLGVSRQAVSKWETGESEPETANLVALAKIYNVSLDELVTGDTTTPVIEAEVVDGPAKAPRDDDDDDDDDDEDDDDDDYKPTRIRFAQKLVGSLGMLLALVAYLLCGFLWRGSYGNVGWASMWVLFFVPPIVVSILSSIEHKKPSHFQITLLVVGVYVGMGIITTMYGHGTWHPWWILFFIIPIYHGITGAIESQTRKER